MPSPFQPRRQFDDAELSRLAESVRQHGLLQPLVVRRRPGEDAVELIAGERRLRAAHIAGLDRVPVVTLDVDDSTAAGIALVENLQRVELNPIERADGLKVLQERFGMTQSEIASHVGLDRSSVANLLRITELDDDVRSMISAGVLTAGHGKALLSVRSAADRSMLARRAASGEWSVRRLERECKSVSEATPGGPPSRRSAPAALSRSAELESLERRVSEHVGAKTYIRAAPNGERGEIVISFYSFEHFDGVLERIGLPPSAD